MSEELKIFSFASTPRTTTPTTVWVVGAGGIGARVVPAVTKLLREGDEVRVWDPDTVEPRNLLRQHFGERDVGMNKAVVMAARYNRPQVPVISHEAEFVYEDAIAAIQDFRTDAARGERRPYSMILLGCVDNKEARRRMLSVACSHSGNAVYIDAGNEQRFGQVLMHSRQWRARVDAAGEKYPPSSDPTRGTSIAFSGADAMPQLFRGDTVQDDQNCGIRVDEQTLAVNNMAACVMINAVAALLTGLPISASGWMFTTFNNITPIPFVGFDTYTSKMLSDMRFAEKPKSKRKAKAEEEENEHVPF
jgi:molybdopterin/thiamine biosynthesis adenylyltransferase